MRDRILDRDLLVTRQKLQLKIDSMLPHNIMDHQHPLRYYDDDHQNYTHHLQFKNLAMQPCMHTWAYTSLGLEDWDELWYSLLYTFKNLLENLSENLLENLSENLSENL